MYFETSKLRHGIHRTISSENAWNILEECLSEKTNGSIHFETSKLRQY